jgi:hypothetical protein
MLIDGTRELKRFSIFWRVECVSKDEKSWIWGVACPQYLKASGISLRSWWVSTRADTAWKAPKETVVLIWF